MKFWQLTKAIIKSLKQPPTKSGKKPKPKLPQLKSINQLCQSQTYSSQIQQQFITPTTHPNQQITNMLLIKKFITVFPHYFILLVLLSLLNIFTLVIQPFLNNYIKQLIFEKLHTNFSITTIQIISIFLSYKITTAILYITSDCLFVILGVKIHALLVKQLIIFQHNQTIDCNLIACIEQDCQRQIFLPFSSFNSILKILQFIILSTMLLSKLPSHQLQITIIYYIFLILLLIMAFYSLKLNLTIMSFKQKRINPTQPPNTILAQRTQQLKYIKYLMIVDSVGLIFPWLIDVGLMMLIYGIIGIDQQQKYFVLIIFGLVRASISGLGTNLNLFAQEWSSLTRITNYITTYNPTLQKLPLVANEQLQISALNKKKSSLYLTQGKNAKLSDILKIAKQSTTNFLFLFLFLTLLLFTSNFMYGFCAKSIISGQSVFSTFNLISLLLQFFSPTLLLWFICRCNLNMSTSVYQPLLSNPSLPIRQFTAEDLNRLSGDIRLLDRQFYLALYGCINRFSSIYSSFVYSAVTLNYLPLSIIFIVLIIGLTIWLICIFDKFIHLRKQCYRKQATNKGALLEKLVTHQDYNSKWKQIYTYKYFGFFIEITFFSAFFTTMTIISFVAIVGFIMTNVSANTTAVFIMLISQLDSQFLVLLVQLINLQLISTAICRCFSVLSPPSH